MIHQPCQHYNKADIMTLEWERDLDDKIYRDIAPRVNTGCD